MESFFETIMTQDELNQFKIKSFTEDEILDLREDLVEYYENAGFSGARERFGIDKMSAEEIIKNVVELMQDMIIKEQEYFEYYRKNK